MSIVILYEHNITKIIDGEILWQTYAPHGGMYAPHISR